MYQEKRKNKPTKSSGKAHILKCQNLCQIFLASKFHTDWLSQHGLGNQVGSTTDHLELFPTHPTKRSK